MLRTSVCGFGTPGQQTLLLGHPWDAFRSRAYLGQGNALLQLCSRDTCFANIHCTVNVYMLQIRWVFPNPVYICYIIFRVYKWCTLETDRFFLQGSTKYMHRPDVWGHSTSLSAFLQCCSSQKKPNWPCYFWCYLGLSVKYANIRIYTVYIL